MTRDLVALKPELVQEAIAAIGQALPHLTPRAHRELSRIAAQLQTALDTPPAPRPRARINSDLDRYWGLTREEMEAHCHGLPAEAVDLALEWWNVSRRQRHSRNAVWTETALTRSTNTLRRMKPEEAIEVLNRAVAGGWQGITSDRPQWRRGEPTTETAASTAIDQILRGWD